MKNNLQVRDLLHRKKKYAELLPPEMKKLKLEHEMRV
jgi:hypothetical protein